MKINKRKLQYASLSSAFIIFFVAVVLLFNVLVGFLGGRFSLMIDLTDNDQFSISDGTKEMLDSLDEEVVIYIMENKNNVDKDPDVKQAAETIERFATASGGKIKYEYVDPNQNPKFYDDFPLAKANKENGQSAFLVISGARRYSSILYSDIVAQNKNQTAMFYSTEAELTGALLHVTSKELSKVASITGHNEIELPGFDLLVDINGFERMTINLAKDSIPEGVNNVVISAPDFDYTAEEIAKLDEFMTRPGSNLYVFWSRTLTRELPVLERFLADWGFEIEPTSVIDLQNAYQTPLLVAANVAANDVTARIPETQQRFFAPQAHPIKILFEQRSNMRVLPISKTSSAAYARLLTTGANITEGRKEDEAKGPFTVAAVSEKVFQTKTGHLEEHRVFLFGSESMADEEIMGVPAAINHTLFNELISYSNPDASTISIAPKMKQSYSLDYYESEISVLFWILVVIVPLIILALGVFIFIRRRHR